MSFSTVIYAQPPCVVSSAGSGDAVGFRRSRIETRGGCFRERNRQIRPSGEPDPMLVSTFDRQYRLFSKVKV
jgi:hypothetical protein